MSVRNKIETICFGQLASMQVKMPEEFWQGRVLYQGCCVLIAGARKSHKTDFFLELAVRATSGGIFLGRRFSRPLKVLYVQAEIRRAYLKERIGMFANLCDEKSLQLIYKNLYVTDKIKLNINGRGDWERLYNTALDLKPDILALDPIISFADIDENSAQQVSTLLYNRIGRLQDSLEANAGVAAPAFILVHHFRKDNESEPDDVFVDIRGSSAWLGWYDTGMVLKKNDDLITVHYETRDCKPPSQQIVRLNREQGVWELAEKPAPGFNDKVAVGVEIVRTAGGFMPSGELRNELMRSVDVQASLAYKVIGELKNHPHIRIKTNGRNIWFTYVEDPNQC